MQIFVKAVVVLTFALLIINLPPVHDLIETKTSTAYLFQTENAELSFNLNFDKGRTNEAMQRQLKSYNRQHETQLKIYRTFKKDYRKVWRWWAYFSNPIWQYDYRDQQSKSRT